MVIPKALRKTVILTSLFLLTAASLSLQVSLTRLFSFLFVQSYVYIIISISMAGLGFGAVTAYFLKDRILHRVLLAAAGIPVLMLIGLFLLNSLSTMLIPSLVCTFLLYASVGIMQIQIFQKSEIPVSQLYAADLIGASVGSLLSYAALNALGTIDVLYLTILILCIIFTIIYRMFFPVRSVVTVLLISAAVLLVTSHTLGLGSRMFPDQDWQKEMTIMLDDPGSDARITETSWTSFGRVDLVETNNPLFKTMFIDGASGTKMIQMEQGTVSRAVAESLLFGYMGGLPLLIVGEDQKDRAVVIGSGGGIDVVTLLLAGYRQIDAVEINPDFIRIVKEQSEYTGGIYTDNPKVNVYLDEGRSFLRSASHRYDLILMGLPIIKSVRNLSNHALTENFLFTHQAFSDYLGALEDDGYLVIIAHYPNELRRLFANAVRALQLEYQITAAEASRNLVSIGDDRNPVLIMKRSAFTNSELIGFETIVQNFPVAGSTTFIPGGDSGQNPGMLNDPAMEGLSEGRLSLDQFIDASEEDISWVSDDSPFFYQMTRGLPPELKLVGAVIPALMVLMIILFLKQVPLHRGENSGNGRFLKFLSFGVIGFGYMLIEVAILQKFINFWRHQTLALSIVLAVILIASGLGSLLSSRLTRNRGFVAVLGTIVVLHLLLLFGLESVLSSMERAAPSMKFLVTAAVVFPVFFFMGMPFPYLLKTSVDPHRGAVLYPWLMGFNSIATLSASILAMVLAMTLGYRSVHWAGLSFYVIQALIVLYSIYKEPVTDYSSTSIPQSVHQSQNI